MVKSPVTQIDDAEVKKRSMRGMNRVHIPGRERRAVPIKMAKLIEISIVLLGEKELFFIYDIRYP